MSSFKSVVVSAGVLVAASDALQEVTTGAKFSDQVIRPAYWAGSVLGLIGAFVLALALLALQGRQADRVGRAGRWVAIATGFGVMLLASINWSTTFLDPAAAKVAPVSSITRRRRFWWQDTLAHWWFLPCPGWPTALLCCAAAFSLGCRW